jgi:hypothetical protein
MGVWEDSWGKMRRDTWRRVMQERDGGGGENQ